MLDRDYAAANKVGLKAGSAVVEAAFTGPFWPSDLIRTPHDMSTPISRKMVRMHLCAHKSKSTEVATFRDSAGRFLPVFHSSVSGLLLLRMIKLR